MRIDKNGKLEMTSRWIFNILEEFGWNTEELAGAIFDLRQEITKLEEELDKVSNMSGEQ